MGYMIQYDPEQNVRYPSAVAVTGRKVWRKMLLILVVVVLLGTAILYRDYLMRCFLPGDGEITALALEELIRDFQTGTPLGEAITTFCREIVESAA